MDKDKDKSDSFRPLKLTRLPPEVNRVLFIKNLPWKITSDEMYDIFGKFGAIRQIRLGSSGEGRGKAFVVYEDIYDAKTACEHLNGFNVLGRYIVVLYYQPKVVNQKTDIKTKKEELDSLKKRFGVKGSDIDK